MKNQFQQPKKCTSCESYIKKYWVLIIVSLYMAFASVYGTIGLVKEIYNYFTH